MSVTNDCEHLIIAGGQKIPASRKSVPAVRRFPASVVGQCSGSSGLSAPSGHRCPRRVLSVGLIGGPGGGGVLLDCHRRGGGDDLEKGVGPSEHTVLVVMRHVAQVLHEERGRPLCPQHGRKRCEVDGFVTHRNAQRLRHFLRNRVVVQFLGPVQRIDLAVVWGGGG